jgi:hypothetical protein
MFGLQREILLMSIVHNLLVCVTFSRSSSSHIFTMLLWLWNAQTSDLWFTSLKGYGQTISAPHMHALALELLKDFAKFVFLRLHPFVYGNNWLVLICFFGVHRPGAKVLDVGSGSGYLSACLAMLVCYSNLICPYNLTFHSLTLLLLFLSFLRWVPLGK